MSTPFKPEDVLFRFTPSEDERLHYDEYAVVRVNTMMPAFIPWVRKEQRWFSYEGHIAIIARLLAEREALTAVQRRLVPCPRCHVSSVWEAEQTNCPVCYYKDMAGEYGKKMTEALEDGRQITAAEHDLRQKVIQSHEEICQVLGLALGYPHYCEDPVNFPYATELEGVCVGDQVAETLALQAAARINALTAERDQLKIQRGLSLLEKMEPFQEEIQALTAERDLYRGERNRLLVALSTSLAALMDAWEETHDGEHPQLAILNGVQDEIIQAEITRRKSRPALEQGAKVREDKSNG